MAYGDSPPYAERKSVYRLAVGSTRRALSPFSKIGALYVASMMAFAATTVYASAPAPIPDYPTKPVRIIVGFPAGGAADILARLIGEKLGAHYGQPFIIENRAGAGGTIGAGAAARSPGDGYTLLMAVTASQTIAPAIYKNLPYKPIKDFTSVAMVATIPVALVVNADVQANNVKELIQLAKDSDPPLAFGSSGVGAIPHLTAVRFQNVNQLNLLHVPFKGSAPALTELLAGRVQLMFDHVPSSLPHILSGKLKALAVAGDERAQALPNVPTLAEAGIDGVSVRSWFGLVAPAGTAPETVKNLNHQVNRLLQTDEVKQAITVLGAEPAPLSVEAFDEIVDGDTKRWAEIVRANEISL